MERLYYNKETQQLLEEGTEKNKWYWRYQDSKFGGVIPVAHQSYERIFDGEAPEHIEEGCSCYDNPYQLMEYISDEVLNLDNTDIILFVGSHKGYGIDEEDIVAVEEDGDVLYSMSLRAFYKFCCKADVYVLSDKNIKECMEQYSENFIQKIWEK